MAEKIQAEAEQEVFNTILQTGHKFSLGENAYTIYPVTLGKELMLTPLLVKTGVAGLMCMDYMSVMALRAAMSQRNDVLRIVAINTIGTKEDLMNEDVIGSRMADIGRDINDEDLASLLVICVREQCKLSRLMELTGIDKDKKHMQVVHNAKRQNRNSITFGGVSIFGRLLDVACERYKWTLDYVLWGITAVNLQLMLADQVTTVYMSDDELKNIGESDEDVINADDPANRERIHELLNRR